MPSNPRPYQVRAKTACEAVGLDRDRFNEDCAANIYTCAPPTEAGKARIFYEPDLIALYFYAHLRRWGLTAERAANVACRVGEQARQLVNTGQDIVGDVVIGFDHAGSTYCGLGKGVSETVDGTQNAFGGTYSPMVMSWRFALQNVLIIVKERVEDLTAARGED
ncbi:hypothetical protein MKK58_09365 [Methylobacterium sp. J-078]|uniref:hypothetical protein n=1 Tax=Methylobacterium sp. J-078 TaxID=2836657 RepID=UPI001FBA5119|nr:hypothetical protein [Methylobacterium sp. J-078]MCJ2044734.1 hypothetical protein [Methylobacterium sp. J-078]